MQDIRQVNDVEHTGHIHTKKKEAVIEFYISYLGTVSHHLRSDEGEPSISLAHENWSLFTKKRT